MVSALVKINSDKGPMQRLSSRKNQRLRAGSPLQKSLKAYSATWPLVIISAMHQVLWGPGV